MDTTYTKNIPDNITHIKIDIGLSYNAPHSNIWLCNEPNLFVFGFEPNPKSVKSILGKQIIPRQNGHGEVLDKKFIDSRFKLIPFALSNVSQPTTMKFHATEIDVGTSSLYKPIDASLGGFEEVNVPVYSLKHFFDIFPFDRFEYIDYIKIDAQGSDLDILMGAGDYLQKVVYITAEESCQYESSQHNTADNMTKYLESQNFIRVFNKETSDPTFLNKKYQHLGDKIYIYQSG